MYTSGCPKNQKRCWNKIGLPPPYVRFSPNSTRAGIKKLVSKILSNNIITALTNNAGKANKAKTVAVKIPHTVKGILIRVMPLVRA